MSDPAERLGAFREVPFMGVIYVVHEAMKRGFVNGHPDWSNPGQGQPEVGPMDGAPRRIDSIRIRPEDQAYGPLEGIPELCQAVADHYNRLYRRGKKSLYGPEKRLHRLRGPARPDARPGRSGRRSARLATRLTPDVAGVQSKRLPQEVGGAPNRACRREAIILRS